MDWQKYRVAIVIGVLWLAFMTWRTVEDGVLDGLLAPLGIVLLVSFVALVLKARRGD